MNPVEFLKEKIDTYNLWDGEIHLKRNDFLKFGEKVDSNVYYIVEGQPSLCCFASKQRLCCHGNSTMLPQ